MELPAPGVPAETLMRVENHGEIARRKPGFLPNMPRDSFMAGAGP